MLHLSGAFCTHAPIADPTEIDRSFSDACSTLSASELSHILKLISLLLSDIPQPINDVARLVHVASLLLQNPPQSVS